MTEKLQSWLDELDMLEGHITELRAAIQDALDVANSQDVEG